MNGLMAGIILNVLLVYIMIDEVGLVKSVCHMQYPSYMGDFLWVYSSSGTRKSICCI